MKNCTWLENPEQVEDAGDFGIMDVSCMSHGDKAKAGPMFTFAFWRNRSNGNVQFLRELLFFKHWVSFLTGGNSGLAPSSSG